MHHPIDRPRWEIADVVRLAGDRFLEQFGASPQQRRVLRAIVHCRTAALGGHIERCRDCHHRRIAYNSCRNRHCPKCQASARARWLEARQADLLPVPYFHVVFTIPQQLSSLALQNPRVVYGILFRAAAQTLQEVAANPRHLGARIGCLAVLHTWGQNLMHHPHLHCVVPAGGLSEDGSRWIPCQRGFFLPVRVLSRVFRGKFIDLLKRAYRKGKLVFHGDLKSIAAPLLFERFLDCCVARPWVVYAKRPFGGPQQVLKYLARYTHRVAISNSRLLECNERTVSFRWKNYAAGDRQETMTLDAAEFLRRFLLHTLPKRFQRIRQFGFLSNRCRKQQLARCRELLQADAASSTGSDTEEERDPIASVKGADKGADKGREPAASLLSCPQCGSRRVAIIEFFSAFDCPLPRPHVRAQPVLINDSS